MALSSQTRLVLTLPLLTGMMWATQGDSSLQQQGPLITKTDSHVLLMECRVPFYLAWMNKWSRSPVDLELTYRPHAHPLQPEIIARLLGDEEEPWKLERFQDDPLVEARAVKMPEAELQKEDKCVNCRTLLLTMPGSYGPHGEYSCSAVYSINDGTRTRTTYTVSVDEKRSDKVINGTLKVEKVLAHKLEVRWRDSESLRGLGRVSVSRTTVDSQGCPLGDMSTAVELFALNRNVDGSPSKLEEVMLNSPATQETSALTLFVREDPFCFPDCTYSCEVSGRRCPESTACERSTCTSWQIAFGVSAGFLFLVILVFVLYTFRCKISTCIREKCRETQEGNQNPPHNPRADNIPLLENPNNPPQNNANNPQENANNPQVNANNPPQDNTNNPPQENVNNPPQDNANNPQDNANNPPQYNANNPQYNANDRPQDNSNNPPQNNPNDPNIQGGTANNPPQDYPNDPNNQGGAANNPLQGNPNDPYIQRGAENNPPALGPRAFTSAVAPDTPPQRASGDRRARGPSHLPERHPSPYDAARGTPLDSALLPSFNVPIPAVDRGPPRSSLDAGVLEESAPLNELELPVSSGYPACPETVHMRSSTEV